MFLSESYKNRLLNLAFGNKKIVQEATESFYKNSNNRMPFNQKEMIDAINRGEIVGLLFQSNNDAYSMPVAKYRIILPVCLGVGKNGNTLLRAIHLEGQSEGAAQKSNIRSAEASNQWKLFNVANIKSMWITGQYFSYSDVD